MCVCKGVWGAGGVGGYVCGVDGGEYVCVGGVVVVVEWRACVYV